MKEKKVTLSAMRNNPLYTESLLLHGNGKLLDYDNPENGEKIRYAQFNTRAVKDCPFRSKGCERVCYATKGNHVFPSCKASREKSFEVSKQDNFSERMVYTIKTEKLSGRYRNAIMQIRLHESGDFYSVQYLKKWIAIWQGIESLEVRTTLYTKSFPFFLMLSEEEENVINRLLESGRLAINFSLDDTTSTEQRIAYLKCIAKYPKANTYTCTENVDSVEHDNICDCADCGKCGTCNKGTGCKTVVKIHSASASDMEEYRKNIK